MRTTLREVAGLVLAAAIALSFVAWAAESPAQQPGGPGGPGGPGAMGAQPDPNDPDVKALNQLRAKIAGKEQAPAESVFDNIKVFRGAPAGRVLGAMGAFTHALGSHCTLCHVEGKYASDDKKEKNIARGMMRFVGVVNDSLHAIPNIDADAHVTCTTCHRGKPKPDEPMRRPGGPGGPGGPGAPGGPGGPGGGPGGPGGPGGGDHH